VLQQATGFAVTRRELAQKAAELESIENPHKSEESKTSRWVTAFMHRFPFLSLRTPSSLTVDRAAAANPTIIADFFEVYQTVLASYPIVSIYNMDESFLDCSDLTHGCKLIGLRGSEQVLGRESGFKEHVTIMDSISNHGRKLPSVFLFKGKYPSENMLPGGEPGARYGCTESGWTNDAMFREYMKFFIDATAEERERGYVLLLLDGHGSHYDMEAVKLAAANNVHILPFPPHCTHVLQPLDTHVFGTFKKAFAAEVWKRCKDAGRVVKTDIGALVYKAQRV
jgi:hypothetical protein